MSILCGHKLTKTYYNITIYLCRRITTAQSSCPEADEKRRNRKVDRKIVRCCSSRRSELVYLVGFGNIDDFVIVVQGRMGVVPRLDAT
jgi:hypothetical protein